MSIEGFSFSSDTIGGNINFILQISLLMIVHDSKLLQSPVLSDTAIYQASVPATRDRLCDTNNLHSNDLLPYHEDIREEDMISHPYFPVQFHEPHPIDRDGSTTTLSAAPSFPELAAPPPKHVKNVLYPILFHFAQNK